MRSSLTDIAIRKQHAQSKHDVLIPTISGFLTGVLSGLVGLGESELRIPFILYGLSLPLHEMVAANLLISLLVSSTNFGLRAHLGLLSTTALLISASMIVGSLTGAFIGASVSRRFTERKMKAFIAIILTAILVRLIAGFFVAAEVTTASSPNLLELTVAAVFGLMIGTVAGSVGVAGGEFQIPVLTMVYGLSIKIAGTASQLVSIPTIIVALLKHRIPHPKGVQSVSCHANSFGPRCAC
jgi:uncharacterized membrane protein YfcA